jgi:very-short-patch-repair endonuclease
MRIHDRPFIGSEALEAGVLRKYELRTRYQAVFPDVYLASGVTPDLRQRAVAAWLWSHREGVIAGLTASAVHGANWIGDDPPIELIWPNARRPRGLRTFDFCLLSNEFTEMDGMRVTTVGRTAFDIGRRGKVDDAVARLDALGNATRFEVDDVLAIAAHHPGARGLRRLATALDLYDSGAESPKETWLRLMLIDEGFPRPQTQIPVLGPDGYPLYYLDMGWEDMMLAVEYDGVQHADQLGYDIVRNEYIAGVGWTTIRVAAGHRRPDIVSRVHRAWDAKLLSDRDIS